MNEHLVFMLQLLITGVAVGGVYALMALGFVLIYKASNVVNFGPGSWCSLEHTSPGPRSSRCASPSMWPSP